MVNFIGIDASGNGAQGNGLGIAVNGSSATIGYPDGGGNVISGNHGPGISIGGGADHATVQANKIGTNAAGNAALGNGGDGIVVASANNLIGGAQANQGNVISANGGSGVALSGGGATQNNIEYNQIGTNADGSSALGNHYGVRIDGAGGNIIGGSGTPNVISGNTDAGIYGSNAPNTFISGNVIGTNAGGNGAVPNGSGIYLSQANGSHIGTTKPGGANVISGNNGIGVNIDSSSGIVIESNKIGASVDNGPLPNNTGVVIGASQSDSQNDLIGGANFGAGNTIAFNSGAGVVIDAGEGHDVSGNTLRSNSIYSNGGLGVDLNGDGVTQNDEHDSDSGGNHLQNAPQLTSATAGGLVLSGELHTTATTSFLMDVFDNESCDPSGYGEGKTYLGSIGVFTNADGVAAFVGGLEVSPPAGHFITATALNVDTGDTSEFSNCVQVGAPPIGTPTPGPTATPEPPTSTPVPPADTPTDTPQATDTPQPTNTPGKETPAPPTATPTSTRTPVPTPAGVMGDVDCNHTANSIDVALILQYGAGLLQSLRCPQGADANHDGRINSIDSALILQFIAGLISGLT
jgi:hypothetical protein